MSNLGNPGVHDFVDVLAGSFSQRIPEGLGLGIAIGVSLEVVGDTLEESLNTEMAGKHADSRASLEVADVIKDLVHIKSVTDRHVDGVTGADTVKAESTLHALIDELRPNLPFRVQVVDGVPSDPGSKAFVEPQLIPPVHGNQVAKPLVSKLVSNDIGDGVLETGIRGLLVEKDLGGAVGDETPVLHGTVGELVDGKQIRLGKRVVNVEDLREVVDNLGGVLESPTALFLETTGGVDTDGNLLSIVSAIGQLLDVLKVTDSPCQEVGAHKRRSLERHHVPAFLGRLDLLHGHVAEGDLVDGDLNIKVVGGLEVRLVEARESSAGIARFELGAEHVVPLVIAGDRGGGSFSGPVFAAVETSHLVVDDAFEFDDDGSLFGNGDLLVKGNGDTLSLFIVGDVGGLPLLLGLCVVYQDLGIVYLELEGVEDNLFGGLDDFGLDAGVDELR